MDDNILFLKNVSEYLSSQTNKEGNLICYKHHIEHTGKNVYSIIIDSKLYELTKDSIYFERAKRRVLRTIKRFGKDPEYGYLIFYPGRLDPNNHSNSIIDGGACADSLSIFIDKFGNNISDLEKTEILQTIFNHCDSYLKKATVEKDITNQRLWGGTGLASAYKLFNEDSWRNALIESISKSFDEQNSDGSFPYHPNYEKYGIFSGISDITPYYHSRHIAFIIHILEILGIISQYIDRIEKGLDFLIGIYQPNGRKSMMLETKRWYWESDYEVASNVFDIYAFIKGFKYLNKTEYLNYAYRSFMELKTHQLKDGGITSHLGRQNNFKCRIFWNSHVAWLARVIEDIPDKEIPLNNSYFKIFNESGVVKFENRNMSIILRGNKKPMNVNWGSPVGGGSMIYFGYRKNNWENVIRLSEWSGLSDFNWVIKKKRNNIFVRLREFLLRNKMDLRFRFICAYFEFKGGRRLFPIYYIFKHIIYKSLSSSGGVYTAKWSTNSELKVDRNSILFILSPSNRDGNILNDVIIKREYIFDEDFVDIKEELISSSNLRIKYVKGSIGKEFNIEPNYRRRKKNILTMPECSRVNIKFRMP